jgi:hypothetical protein
MPHISPSIAQRSHISGAEARPNWIRLEAEELLFFCAVGRAMTGCSASHLGHRANAQESCIKRVSVTNDAGDARFGTRLSKQLIAMPRQIRCPGTNYIPGAELNIKECGSVVELGRAGGVKLEECRRALRRWVSDR